MLLRVLVCWTHTSSVALKPVRGVNGGELFTVNYSTANDCGNYYVYHQHRTRSSARTACCRRARLRTAITSLQGVMDQLIDPSAQQQLDDWLASLPDDVLFGSSSAPVPEAPPSHARYLHAAAGPTVDMSLASASDAPLVAAEAPSKPIAPPGWGSLRAPTARDVRGRGGLAKGFMAPPEAMQHLVVLDFEWTADNRQRVLPCAEITQFPSVLVSIAGHASAIVDEFDTFVRPTLNPALTPFSIALTAITQQDVDSAPTISEVLPRYIRWLQGHGLVDARGHRLGRWSFCTWSDADIGGTLVTELREKRLALPPCFDDWIDLKVHYKRRYRREPRGLRACVEALGLPFVGRAHNGLVDSQNTARIVLHMARGEGMYGPAHTFTRPTRALAANGSPYGSKKRAR